MVKEFSHHQPKNKKPLAYNSDGLHFAEMLALAEDHPFFFRVVLLMLFCNVPDVLIIKFIDKVV